jgi:hypothetical protein
VGQCRYCGKHGFLLSVDEFGLCAGCRPGVALDITQRTRIVNESSKHVEESKNLSTRLSRCDLAIQHLEYIHDTYELRGIMLVAPSAEEQIAKLVWARDECVVEDVQAKVEKAKRKADIATTATTRVNAYSPALLAIAEGKPEMRDSSRLEPYEVEVKRAMHTAQLSGYVEAAEKAEFKGNAKKALDQYQEALYFLKTDDVDDELQAAELARISSKIADLGGSVGGSVSE